MTGTPFRRMVKHSSVYMAGVLFSRVISFIMLPIYTRFLTPADYGVLELLSMSMDVLAMLAGAGITAALLRYYSEKETTAEKNAVVTTALLSTSMLFFLCFGLVVLLARPVAGLVLGDPEMAHLVRLFAIAMAMLATVEIPLVLLRAQQRPVPFVLINAAKLVLQLSLNILFVVYLRRGVEGVLWSNLITTALLSLYLVGMTIRSAGLSFSPPLFRELLRYGYPLIFSNLGAFILSFSDRYFIKAFGTLYQVGIYSLGYKFGALITSLVLTPFLLFWNVEMFELDKRPDRGEVFPKVLTMLSLVAVVLMFGVAVYVPEVLRVMADPTFWDAGQVVALICLAYYLYMIENHVRSALLITKHTKQIAYATTIAAASCLLLNGLLIPPYGVYGAAAATVASYLVRLLLVLHWSQKVYPLRYEWGRIILLPLLAGVFLLISYRFSDMRLVPAIIKDTAAFILFSAVVYFVWMRPRERELVRRVLLRPREALKLLLE